MVKSFGSALTALGLIGGLAACANPGAGGPRYSTALGAPAQSNAGLALRAQDALAKGDNAAAVDFAERAVEGSPRDAGFRGLLGNAYFASGRFASAEAAYRDALTLSPGDGQVALKLALVMIAQGKNGDALAQLETARNYLDPADYGLALALAGQPQMATAILEQAARDVRADARIRQNLALALALQGDWTAARTIAAQDIPADQVDLRVQQWMAFAKPARASDQVAALTGITPAASDPGQPVRLALTPPTEQVRVAAADPVVVPMAEQAPAPVEYAAAPAPIDYAAAPAPAPEPVMIATADPVAFAPPVAEAPKSSPRRTAAKAKAKAPAAKPGLSARGAGLVHKASFPKLARGNSKSVVQIGAYAQRSFVGTAWNSFAKKYPALRDYSPSTARFQSAKGTVYRLSVQGFASDSAARDFCSSLKKAGGTCFVRTVAGDAPVRLASL